MLRQGVLLKTFSSATYCLPVAVTFREKAWEEFPDAAFAMDVFSGWLDSPSREVIQKQQSNSQQMLSAIQIALLNPNAEQRAQDMSRVVSTLLDRATDTKGTDPNPLPRADDAE